MFSRYSLLKKITYLFISIFLTLGLSLSLQSLLAAWTAPTANPPDDNVKPPIYNDGSPTNPIVNHPFTVNDNFYVGVDDFFVDYYSGNVAVGTTTDISAKVQIVNEDENKDTLLVKSKLSFKANFIEVIGGSGDDFAYSVLQTADGGYIVVGKTDSFGAGQEDAFVLKLDFLGKVEWAKTVGGPKYDYAYSVQQLTDDRYIVVGETYNFTSDGGPFIFRLLSTGEFILARVIDVLNSGRVFSIQPANVGGGGNNYIVGGSIDNEGVILKIEGSSLTWAKHFGVADNYGITYVYFVQQTTDSGYVAAVRAENIENPLIRYPYILKLNFSGELEWARKISNNEWDGRVIQPVQQTADGGYIIIRGAEITKLNSSGKLEWVKAISSSIFEGHHLDVIQQTIDDGYILVGETYDFGAVKRDIFIVKLNSLGNLEWARTIGGSGYDYAYSIQQTTDGGYIVVGRTDSFETEGYDIFIIKLDSNGNIPGCSYIQSVSPEVKSISNPMESVFPNINSLSLSWEPVVPEIFSPFPQKKDLCREETGSIVKWQDILAIDKEGELGIWTSDPEYTFEVNGSFAASTKNFDIPDPRYQNSNQRLVHSSLEGPEHGVYYRGEGKLENGQATIKLPEYFEALTRKEGRTVLLTPKFKNLTEPISQLTASEVRNGQFTVRAVDSKNPNQEFFWEVKAIRADVPELKVEIERNNNKQ